MPQSGGRRGLEVDRRITAREVRGSNPALGRNIFSTWKNQTLISLNLLILRREPWEDEDDVIEIESGNRNSQYFLSSSQMVGLSTSR